jgi:hypothetical protein
MKTYGQSHAKLKKQRFEFVRGLHYDRVAEVGKDKAEKERREKRFDIIVTRNIKKGGTIILCDEIAYTVKSIAENGIITLNDWREIDPLNL